MNFDDQVKRYLLENEKNNETSITGKGEYTHSQFVKDMEQLKAKTTSEGLKQMIDDKIKHHNMEFMEMEKNYMQEKVSQEEYSQYKEFIPKKRTDDYNYLKGHVESRDEGGPWVVMWIVALVALVIIAIVVIIVLVVKHTSNIPALGNTEKFNTVRSDRFDGMNESFGAFVERGPSVTYPDPYIKYNYYDDLYDKNQSQFDDKFCDAGDDSEDSMQENYSVGRIVQPQYL